MDSAVGVGVAGVIGGLVGSLAAGLGGPVLAARRANAAWLREQRVILYTDALRHVAGLRHMYIDREAGEPPGGKASLAPQDDVTARMTLLGQTNVRQAWSAVVDKERVLDNWVNNMWEGPHDEVPLNHRTSLQAAMDSLVKACQEAFGNKS